MSLTDLSPVDALSVDGPCRMFLVVLSVGDLLELLVSCALGSEAEAEAEVRCKVEAVRLLRGA